MLPRPSSAGTRGRRRVLATVALVLVGSLPACTSPTPNPGPTAGPDTAQRAAAELAAGLSQRDLGPVEFVGSSGAEVDELFQPVVAGMEPATPAVTVGPVEVQDTAATAVLSYVWTFPGIVEPWTYDTRAQLVLDGGRWKASWQPDVLAPELDGSNRLTQKRLAPDRGELLGAAGDAIVTSRPVVRLGLDKSQLTPAQAKTSATRLAGLVKINPTTYAAKVADAGSEAFVEAITYRATAADRPSNAAVFAIRGALPIEAEQMLAPDREFARALIGTVGEATKEVVDASKGAVVGGDQVGLSGLQKRYDTQLRGTAGVQVQLVAQTRTSSATPTPSPSPSPSTTAKPVTVFEVAPQAGKPLETTLNVDLQRLAESTLAKTKPASAIVAIRPSTGAILAAANGPGSDQAVATTGQFPPGSTFKIASALALLRAGLSPSAPVTCPVSVDVDGKKFTNYSDYPKGSTGRIDLRTAVAQSCNTAFIGQRAKLKASDLESAAASLGFGTDYDVGFPSFFGSAPVDPSSTGQAAALIGQGKVQASPMAMASVAASVAAGKTVLPHLIEAQQPKPTARPLTAAEARQLREMMRAVVTEGSGRALGDVEPPAVIAKTGTAEYGSTSALKTHAWMIAAQGDLAVAVFVNDGESGSRTAGPLLKAFLEQA